MQNVAGSNIKYFHRQKKPSFTQDQLASVLQLRGMTIDRAGVAKIECGFRKISDIEIVIIAGALGVTPGELLPAASDSAVKSKTRKISQLPTSDSVPY